MPTKSKYEIVPPADTPEYMWPAYYAALFAAIKTPDIMGIYILNYLGG